MVGQKRSSSAATSSRSSSSSQNDSKRRQTNQAAPAAAANKPKLVEHVYAVKELSDMVITLNDDGIEHQYIVHRQTLAHDSEWFNTLAIVGTSASKNQPVRVQLPDSFQWTAPALTVWLDLCYGRYEELLYRFAHAPSSRQFAEWVFGIGTRCSMAYQPDADQAGVWLVDGYTDEGFFRCRRVSDNQLVEEGTTSCIVPLIGSSEEGSAEVIEGWADVLEMLCISRHFRNERLTRLFTNIVIKFTAIADQRCTLLQSIAEVLKELDNAELHKACVEQIAIRFNKNPTLRSNLVAMPADILVDVMAAVAGKSAAKLAAMEAKFAQPPPVYEHPPG